MVIANGDPAVILDRAELFEVVQLAQHHVGLDVVRRLVPHGITARSASGVP